MLFRSKSRLDRIFDGYFSAEQRSDAKRRNAGIGLSVCSTIINAHGGSISAENLAAGGAVFRFSLSVADGNDIIDYNEENNI